MALVKFKQSDEIALHSSDPVDQEGVCWALCLKWLSLSLQGKSDEQAGRIGLVKGWVDQAILLQREYATLHAATASEAAAYSNPGALKAAGLIQFFGARVGLKIDRGKPKEVMISTDGSFARLDAIGERLKTAGTGHMLSFQYANGTGHAMATRARKSGFWHTFANSTFLFDPNGGELDMNQTTLKDYLRNHFNSNGATSLLIIKVTTI